MTRPAHRRIADVRGSTEGFSPEQRGAVTPIQNLAARSGKLIKPAICSICGLSDPTDPKARGYIFMHLEDYRRGSSRYPTSPSTKAGHPAGGSIGNDL